MRTMWWAEVGRGVSTCGTSTRASQRPRSGATPAPCQLCPGTPGAAMWSVWTRPRHALSGPEAVTCDIMHNLLSTKIYLPFCDKSVNKTIKYKQIKLYDIELTVQGVWVISSLITVSWKAQVSSAVGMIWSAGSRNLKSNFMSEHQQLAKTC